MLTIFVLLPIGNSIYRSTPGALTPLFCVYPEVRGKTEIWRPDPGHTLPRPAVLLAKIELYSEVLDFSQHFRNDVSASRVLATKATSATTSSNREYIKGSLPETEQRPFFVSASRRVNGGCITENTVTSSDSTGRRIAMQLFGPRFYLNKARGCPPLGRNPLQNFDPNKQAFFDSDQMSKH